MRHEIGQHISKTHTDSKNDIQNANNNSTNANLYKNNLSNTMNKTYGVKDESGCQAQSAMISPGNALLKIEGLFDPKNTQSFS